MPNPTYPGAAPAKGKPNLYTYEGGLQGISMLQEALNKAGFLRDIDMTNGILQKGADAKNDPTQIATLRVLNGLDIPHPMNKNQGLDWQAIINNDKLFSALEELGNNPARHSTYMYQKIVRQGDEMQRIQQELIRQNYMPAVKKDKDGNLMRTDDNIMGKTTKEAITKLIDKTQRIHVVDRIENPPNIQAEHLVRMLRESGMKVDTDYHVYKNNPHVAKITVTLGGEQILESSPLPTRAPDFPKAPSATTKISHSK